MNIGQAFDQTAAYYDDWIKKAQPRYEEIFSIVKDLIPFSEEIPIRVLDLGAGTGLFAWHVIQKYPQAQVVLYDLAEQMLEVAKERFRDYTSQIVYKVGDYRSLQDLEPFDLVVSSLSIHHLTNEEKQDLFKGIYGILKSPGIFINVDQIKPPTPDLKEIYKRNWLENLRAKGASEERIQESMERRATYDKDALLTDQIAWLQAAGFECVDCIYKYYFMGVFFAVK
ncbi:MAG: class I SAM-dependent methyltransferase [Chloroflexota bacterium]